MAAEPDLFDKIVNLTKRRGFVYPSAEIYGGFRSTYDYGPIGVLLLRNVKDAWWRSMVQLRERHRRPRRLDPLAAPGLGGVGPPGELHRPARRLHATATTASASTSSTIPTCARTAVPQHSFTEPRQFNLMFKTQAGPVEDAAAVAYLRPETAQGMFINFKNVLDTTAGAPAVRHRADRQVVPQRDHARPVRVPHP